MSFGLQGKVVVTELGAAAGQARSDLNGVRTAGCLWWHYGRTFYGSPDFDGRMLNWGGGAGGRMFFGVRISGLWNYGLGEGNLGAVDRHRKGPSTAEVADEGNLGDHRRIVVSAWNILFRDYPYGLR